MEATEIILTGRFHSGAKLMDAQDTITITRDYQSHTWSIIQGSHNIPTPWRDTADAVSVVTWLKTKMGGTAKVQVQI